MTTAWAQVVRGHPVRALRANVGGTLLALLAIVAGPWSVAVGVTGRWVWRPLPEVTSIVVSVLILVVTLIDWAMRVFFPNWS